MFDTFVWEFQEDEKPIVFSYMFQDTLEALLEPVRIAAIVVLAKHFPKMPVARLGFVVSQALQREIPKLNSTDSLDSIEIDIIEQVLNRLLVNVIRQAFDSIHQALKQIRTTTIDYIIIRQTTGGNYLVSESRASEGMKTP